MESTLQPIPQPPGLPFLGNVTSIDSHQFTTSLAHLADKHGAIYRLNLMGQTMIVISSYELMEECYNDDKFKKSTAGDINDLRDLVHDGLFTARGEEEENWGIAHRVLMSAFGPLAIRNLFGEMHDIATQLALKWARTGSSVPIRIGDDFTRLALDTVALCSMGFRFNSFYKEEMHPLVNAMYGVLTEVIMKPTRFLPKIFYRNESREYGKNISILRDTALEVVRKRKEAAEGQGDRNDLLDAMLNGVDPVTNKKLSDESIVDNLLTFLIAGHETTGSSLTFIIYYLLANPEVYQKAQLEVDNVIGKRAIHVEDVGKFLYLNAIFRESFRLSAPVPGIGREPLKTEIIGGKYEVHPGDQIVANFPKIQCDPKVFGDRADVFDPDRMYEENFDHLLKKYPHAWKPFGSGIRSCIGRPFAWQEMILNIAILLQNFNLVMDDPAYKLKLSQTLTVKPADFTIRAFLRDGITPATLEARLMGRHDSTNGTIDKSRVASMTSKQNAGPDLRNIVSRGESLSIYYGSDTGTSQFMAHQLANDATTRGFQVEVDVLDAAKEALPTNRPVIIITSTYEGQPAQNARHFVNWMQSLKANELAGVRYCVYGCGHSDWANTFQRIPKMVDDILETHGAERLIPRESTNAKDRDMFSDFEKWADQSLWPAIESVFGKPNSQEIQDLGLSISLSSPRASILRHEVKEAIVVDSTSLVQDGHGPMKKHMDILLPSDESYTAGDYLAILPHNPTEVISRVMKLFGLAWDAHIQISGLGWTNMPAGTNMSVSTLLSAYVELGQVATRKHVATLRHAASALGLEMDMESLSEDKYETDILSKQLSVLDILENNPGAMMPFSIFLQMLPPMRVRQYSISSSPLVDPSKVKITYSVLDAPSSSGGGRRHKGVASTYLASLSQNDRIQVAVRQTSGGFRLPKQVASVPIVCIAIGTGLAPFRSFIEERSVLLQNGQSLAPALLFFGCRYPVLDEIHQQEFQEWEKAGAVEIFKAFSREPEAALGCGYVQDRMWRERQLLVDMYKQGARFYVCGSGKMASDVKGMFIKIMTEDSDKPMSPSEARKWFESVGKERFVTDVFD